MAQKRTVRALIATLVAILAGVGALLLPTPLDLLAAAVAGAGLCLLLVPGGETHAPRVQLTAAGIDERDEKLPAAAELMHAFDDPLLLVRDRRVLLANEAARALLGDHIEGADVRMAIRHPAAAERLSGGANDEADSPIELVGLGDADRRWLMAATLLGDGSRLVRLTDRSHAHAAEQMRADFVANASHELRTPLATLLGFIETLQEAEAGGDEATRNRFLKVMFEEASRMRCLVDDLMSLSRIEAERYTVPRDPVDLIPLIDEVGASLAALLTERDSILGVENEAGGTVVAGDRAQLAQLLNNLLVNALRYGRAGKPIRVRLDDAGAELIRLSVIDQGEGIAPEHLPRLTERFYRVDPGRSRALGGTGLGLAIVKHIVGRHRGRLDIRSTPGEGTHVRVYLPRAQAARSEDAQAPLSSKSHVSSALG